MADMLCQWRFDEGRGPVAVETCSGRASAISHVFASACFKPSSDPTWRKGIAGTALLFDGYSTHLRFGSPIPQIGPSFSIEAWVAPRALEHGHGGKLSAIVNQFDAPGRKGFVFGLGRHGHWGLRLGDGSRILTIDDAGDSLPRSAWSHLVAVVDDEARTLSLYRDGRHAASTNMPEDFRFAQAEGDLLIGRTADNERIHGTFNLNMFAGLIDEVALYHGAFRPAQIAARFADALRAHGGELPAADTAIDPAQFEGDPYRPRFHAIVPGHWMNEPHAPFFYDGRYHLFCQFNPFGPFFHELRWGHWVSDNLVNWRFVGEALTQDEALAPDGVWSGSATLDASGAPVLFFTAANRARRPDQAIGLARAANLADPLLADWIKHPRLVLEQDPALGLSNDFRDPFVWREGKRWFMLVGSSDAGRRGCAQLYESGDLEHWRHRGDLYRYDEQHYPWLGPVWELPVLLPIGRYPDGERRYIFLVSPVGEGADVEIFYWLGRFDQEEGRFRADRDAPRLIDYGDFHFTGPSGMVDPVSGRTLLFTIAQGERAPEEEHDAGWAHNAGLPVVLSLDADGALLIDPVEELALLRTDVLVQGCDLDRRTADHLLNGIAGRMLEIAIEIEPLTAQSFGLDVARSPEDRERTRIRYDRSKNLIELDRTRTSAARDYGVAGGPLELVGGVLSLRIFIDHSMIEIYANRRQSLTSRIYATSPDATGMRLWSDGELRVRSLSVWRLRAA